MLAAMIFFTFGSSISTGALFSLILLLSSALFATFLKIVRSRRDAPVAMSLIIAVSVLCTTSFILDQSDIGFGNLIDNRNLNGGPIAEFHFMLNQFLNGFAGDFFEVFPRAVGQAELRWTTTKITMVVFRFTVDIIAVSWLTFIFVSFRQPKFLVRVLVLGLPRDY